MINPVSSNETSFAKKAATAAGVAAVAASAIYAVKKGQLPDSFEGGKVKQTVAKAADGYKQLGGVIKKGAAKVADVVGGAVKSVKEKFAKKAPEAVEEMADFAEEAAEGLA